MPASNWDRLLETQRIIQDHFPELILVGGTASALHAHHRVSLDADHVLSDLRETFETVLTQLELLSDWKTNRLRPPVLILGQFDDMETGIRQLIRQRPLETTILEGLRVPTIAEMTRVKGWLVVKRNTTRDYLDFCALSHQCGAEFISAMTSFDACYPQPSSESALRQLVKQLAEPHPYDLGNPATLATRYQGLEVPWTQWTSVTAFSQQLAQILMVHLLEGLHHDSSPS